MAEVLVLVDHVDGAVRKTTLELLTIAARLGEPSAVFLGDGLEQARTVAGRVRRGDGLRRGRRRPGRLPGGAPRPRSWPSWSSRPRRPPC